LKADGTGEEAEPDPEPEPEPEPALPEKAKISASDYKVVAAGLLARLAALDGAGPDGPGCLGQDLIDTFLVEQSVEADDLEARKQLVNVVRRMIKHDKSIVAVKSAVKGSKRVDDLMLRRAPPP